MTAVDTATDTQTENDASAGGKPLTRRGEETRRALLRAATSLFAERGFHATSVADIVRVAGVGHGTFYEYFRSRRDILLALTAERASSRPPRLASQSTGERIRSEIFWYLSDHVEHQALSKVWYEASHLDSEIAETRRQERAFRVERVRRGMESGNVPPGIDLAVAAAALTAMIEEFARRWFDEGDGPGRTASDIVAASETITTMWFTVCGLEQV